MAAAWLALLTFSVHFLVAGGYKLPVASAVALGKDVGAPGPADDGEPVSTAPQKWEWKASPEGSHEGSILSRRKREDGATSKEAPKKSIQAEETKAAFSTSLGLNSGSKVAKPSPSVATAPTSQGKVDTLPFKGATLSKGPKMATPSPTPQILLKKASDIAKGAPDGGGHFVSKGISVATKVSSEAVLIGKENTIVPLADTGNVSATTEYWPWLHDHTSDAPQADVSTPAQEQDGKAKGVTSPTAAESWLRGLSTIRGLTSVDNLDASTVDEGMETHRPVPRAKGKSSFSLQKASPSWAWADEMSTATSQTWVEDHDTSTATLGWFPGTEKTSWKGKGGPGSPLRGTTGHGPAMSTAAAALPKKPATAPSPRGAPDLLGKCLLAISLLALVAGVFIVLSTVLAILLWHRNRAYKRDCRHHTEMVCISSLLAAEEAEEAGHHRPPRAKRLTALAGSNGLEAEADNLTLNSFLPEH